MPNSQGDALMHGTTVLCVRKDNKVVLIADGQVTMGDHVMKHTARKTRRLYNDKVIAGFAGSTADAISLFERFEGKLQEHSGNLQKVRGRARQGMAQGSRAASSGSVADRRRHQRHFHSCPATAT